MNVQELQEKVNNTINPLHGGLQLSRVLANNPEQRVDSAIGWARDEINRKVLNEENLKVLLEIGEIFSPVERQEYRRRILLLTKSNSSE